MNLCDIKHLHQGDIPLIVTSFADANWPKSASIFEQYLEEQEKGERFVWIAFWEGVFAGYVTLKLHSDYASFREQNIPEINDLNVLPRFRNQEIGSALLDVAENLAHQKNQRVGIGAGLYADYGPAQRLYVKRGYVPDGKGVTYNYESVQPGANVTLDDDLVLWFVK